MLEYNEIQEYLASGKDVIGYSFTHEVELHIRGGYASIAEAYKDAAKEAKDDGCLKRIGYHKAYTIKATDIVSVEDIREAIESRYEVPDLSINEEAFDAFLTQHVLLNGTSSQTWLWESHAFCFQSVTDQPEHSTP